MPPVTGGSAEPAGQVVATGYDSFAEAYSARIAAIDEPLPAPDTPRELLPDFRQDKPPGSGFLCFMFFVLETD